MHLLLHWIINRTSINAKDGFELFVGFKKALKKMTGFRLGLGICANKKLMVHGFGNILLFIEIFRLMRYMIIGAGYMLCFMCAAIYKIYYCMVKGTVLGYRKLHPRKKNKTAA